MKLRLWGVRGTAPVSDPAVVEHGGNTPCVAITTAQGRTVVLDAGSGMRKLGPTIPEGPGRIHLLLSHLHMDHIQGLGLFSPLFDEEKEVHIWGPALSSGDLHARLTRYLSPPLFPVRLKELPCHFELHALPRGRFEVAGLQVHSDYICHPGPTVGFRVEENGASLCYLPDHEPALCNVDFPGPPDLTSGYALAAGVDLLLHDAQYDDVEYERHAGWGHSSVSQAIRFADHVGARRLVTMHHDPMHDDETIRRMTDEAIAGSPEAAARVEVRRGREGDVYELGAG